LKVTESVQSLNEYVREQRDAGKKIALVPTMGNLHQGHLDLVARARELADRVIVSIFVNPLQFEPGGDLDNYPRTLAADTDKLLQAGADLLFAPDVNEIYAKDLSKTTQVVVPGLSSLWCGASRAGHFQGVSTIVNKLLNMAQADFAVFGEKDFQQLCIIRKMVADLNMPVSIIAVPTRREADGLAMSSRNAYLSSNERKIAAKLREVMVNLQEKISSGQYLDYQKAARQALETLHQAGFKTDYLAICRQSDLQLAEPDDKDLVILAAAYLGKARLIDNCIFSIAGH